MRTSRSCSRLPLRRELLVFREEEVQRPCPQGEVQYGGYRASEGELGAAKPYPTLGELRSSTQGSEVPPVPSRAGERALGTAG